VLTVVAASMVNLDKTSIKPVISLKPAAVEPALTANAHAFFEVMDSSSGIDYALNNSQAI
jgi:hypothetical protein